MSVDNIWRIREDVAWVDDSRGLVALALHRADSLPVAFTGTAADIWKVIVDEGPISGPALTTLLAELFGVSVSEIEGDVVAFLGDLESGGFAHHTPRI